MGSGCSPVRKAIVPEYAQPKEGSQAPPPPSPASSIDGSGVSWPMDLAATWSAEGPDVRLLAAPADARR